MVEGNHAVSPSLLTLLKTIAGDSRSNDRPLEKKDGGVRARFGVVVGGGGSGIAYGFSCALKD